MQSLNVPFDPKTVTPSLELENIVLSMGYGRISGIDEAGRGPLCGPVVAASVVLDLDNIPAGLNDSKKLSAAKRRALFHEIVKVADVGVGIVSAREIDQINILQATFLAMTRAAGNLSHKAEFHLIDGDKRPPALFDSSAAVVKGDARSLSVAAASIIAKVTRDRIMELADMNWPGYGFAKHSGYGTKAHIDAIARLGPSPIHRMTFAPLKVAA
ncbi:ribonuclease HII [Agrobacterium rubi]|nr:ribonuclease HII [Agrobacterium rubi]NTF24122.1 ribonuclease HII [Agrobacterium rubi]